MSEKQKQSSSLNDPEDWSWDGRYEEEMKEESVIYSRKQSDPAMRRRIEMMQEERRLRDLIDDELNFD
ncbi:PA3496 family putative envelope integrity protein [Marinobacterium jannaschii]|uniref:PA3496 family putative envelope integrity protein n=1 Tax=Marinobacterium jannaschii TaxID=64970 RepID=UPI000480FD64|nr:hypothetical protein [Marinobacterium jannaschii]